MALCRSVRKKASQHTREEGWDFQGPERGCSGDAIFQCQNASTILLVKAIMAATEALFILFPRE